MDLRTTLAPQSIIEQSGIGIDEESLLFVLVWSRDEMERLGEVLMIRSLPNTACHFGRDLLNTHPGMPGLAFYRQRPGALVMTGPPYSRRISRDHLHFSVLSSDTVRVDNVGKRPLLHNGRRVSSAEVIPGDTIGIERTLMLLCLKRVATIPELTYVSAGKLQPFGEPDQDGIVGESPETWRVREDIQFLARRSGHVAIFGPSGAGKELVARALHRNSNRSHREMIARNCATIPESLIEAELFGQVKNYPNVGSAERLGMIGTADKSSLFLDEFGELSESLQARLLRVMDEGEYTRLGESKVRKADIRVFGATNRPEVAIKTDIFGRFQHKLRLKGVNERREDIPLLATFLLKKIISNDQGIAEQLQMGAHAGGGPELSFDLVDYLVRHDYRTNTREIESILWTAIQQSSDGVIGLPKEQRMAARAQANAQGHTKRSSDGVTSKTRRSPTTTSEGQVLREAAEIALASEREREWREELGAHDWKLLQLQRQLRFKSAKCAEDQRYPGSRTTADFHMRVWMARGLGFADWDITRAAQFLGATEELREIAEVRIIAFLKNMLRHKEKAGDKDFEQYLRRQYRAQADYLISVVSAMENGLLDVGRSLID